MGSYLWLSKELVLLWNQFQIIHQPGRRTETTLVEKGPQRPPVYLY